MRKRFPDVIKKLRENTSHGLSKSIHRTTRNIAHTCFIILISSIAGNSYGITYYQIGNSLTYDSYPFNGAFVEVANTNGQNITDNGWHIRAGKQLDYIHENPADPDALLSDHGSWQDALAGNQWDIVTFQPFNGGSSTLGTDTAVILDWIDLIRMNNSATSYYVYAAWPKRSFTVSYSEQWLGHADNDISQPAILNRAYFNYLVERIESGAGAEIGIIPVGEVWYRIEQLAKTGVITEINSAYDLYRDNLHANDLGKSVIAWTLFASIFDKSAVDVELGEEYARYNDGPVVMDHILARKLQHAVDDVVFSPRADSNSDGVPDSIARELGLSVYDPDGDTDNDFKSDLIELGRDQMEPLDSDGDGVIDALETDPDDIDASTASGIRLVNEELLTLRTGNNEMLSEVSVFEAVDAPGGIDFPYGVILYKTTAPLSGKVTVQFEFSANLPENIVLYKVDNDNRWVILPESLWTKTDPATVAVTLIDADPRIDLDSRLNGIIEDPLAIGVINEKDDQPVMEPGVDGNSDTNDGPSGAGKISASTGSLGYSSFFEFAIMLLVFVSRTFQRERKATDL